MSLDQLEQNESQSLEDIHHDVLLQNEAILFASDSPVSIDPLKVAFQNVFFL
ncbi:SMC-Scp complex subunit ScpB, partial [Acinetobacter calcoaceticus]